MENLRDITNETISLWIAQGANRINIHMFESHQGIGHLPKLGDVAPIYAGASGKILLSQLQGKDLSSLVQRLDLKPLTSTTTTSKESLLLELDKIRNQGYSWTIGETYEGASAISVSINNYISPIALMLAGPEERIGKVKPFLIDKVKECSISISNKLLKAFGKNTNILKEEE